ncbi:hypothetical protein Bpfe_002901 [Biomphalaria pfeifferi]|uniref:Uncharacterized protein n=1 Tax=Biomphalaria pfeifferi TaxID=112525 RepID=A0AAD8C6M0_BIOPF|nr:hypothetical protein Bpfe_002901 [Biomphalaria pfeifferi]
MKKQKQRGDSLLAPDSVPIKVLIGAIRVPPSRLLETAPSSGLDVGTKKLLLISSHVTNLSGNRREHKSPREQEVTQAELSTW